MVCRGPSSCASTLTIPRSCNTSPIRRHHPSRLRNQALRHTPVAGDLSSATRSRSWRGSMHRRPRRPRSWTAPRRSLRHPCSAAAEEAAAQRPGEPRPAERRRAEHFRIQSQSRCLDRSPLPAALWPRGSVKESPCGSWFGSHREGLREKRSSWGRPHDRRSSYRAQDRKPVPRPHPALRPSWRRRRQWQHDGATVRPPFQSYFDLHSSRQPFR